MTSFRRPERDRGGVPVSRIWESEAWPLLLSSLSLSLHSYLSLDLSIYMSIARVYLHLHTDAGTGAVGACNPSHISLEVLDVRKQQTKADRLTLSVGVERSRDRLIHGKFPSPRLRLTSEQGRTWSGSSWLSSFFFFLLLFRLLLFLFSSIEIITCLPSIYLSIYLQTISNLSIDLSILIYLSIYLSPYTPHPTGLSDTATSWGCNEKAQREIQRKKLRQSRKMSKPLKKERKKERRSKREREREKEREGGKFLFLPAWFAWTRGCLWWEWCDQGSELWEQEEREKSRQKNTLGLRNRQERDNSSLEGNSPLETIPTNHKTDRECLHRSTNKQEKEKDAHRQREREKKDEHTSQGSYTDR